MTMISFSDKILDHMPLARLTRSLASVASLFTLPYSGPL
jgi:hypothetical protein